MVLSCFLNHRNYFPIDFQPFPALCDGQVVPSQKPGYRMGSRVLRHFGDGFWSNFNIADVDFSKIQLRFPKILATAAEEEVIEETDDDADSEAVLDDEEVFGGSAIG